MAGALLGSMRMREMRSARRFMKLRYPERSFAGQAAGLVGWTVPALVDVMPRTAAVMSVEGTDRRPYWLREDNPLAGTPWRSQPDAVLPPVADVVVIGAGFGGAALAHHWSQAGAGQMVVLERDEPAAGAAGRNAGFVAMAGGWYPGHYVHAPAADLLRTLRPELAVGKRLELADRLAGAYVRLLESGHDEISRHIATTGTDCDYRRDGWYFAPDGVAGRALDQAMELAGTQGWNFESRTVEEVSAATGMAGTRAGALSGGVGTWHPARWVWQLLVQALATGGVDLFTSTAAWGIERQGPEYVVTTSRGALRARKVVLATESWTNGLAGDWLRDFHSFAVPHRSQGAFASPRPAHMPIGPAASSGVAWFHARDDGMLFGSDTTPIPEREVGLNDPSRFVTMTAASEAIRLYGLETLRLEHEWSGTVALAPDKMPVVGPVDGQGLWMCGAYAGAGSVASWVCAREVVGAMTGRSMSDDMRAFSIERFRRHGRYPGW